jgi:hypothetical protein
MKALVVVLATIFMSVLGAHSDDPYLFTFLKHRSFKSEAQIRSTKPVTAIVDDIGNSCVLFVPLKLMIIAAL